MTAYQRQPVDLHAERLRAMLGLADAVGIAARDPDAIRRTLREIGPTLTGARQAAARALYAACALDGDTWSHVNRGHEALDEGER